MELRQLKHKVEGNRFRLVFLGDAHVGVIHCEEDRLRKDIVKIAKDPACRVIFMGDSIDAINFSDKRFDPECIKPSYALKDLAKLAQVQTSDFIEMTRASRSHIDGFFAGNHEYEALKRYHFDVTDALLVGLELNRAAFLQTAAILRYNIEGENGQTVAFTVYAEHGSGSSSTPQMALTRIKKKGHDIDADLFAMGHHHKRIWDTEPVLGAIWQGKGKLKERRRGFISTGSYLKTYVEGVSGYGERRSYSPVELGSVVVEWDLTTGTFDIHNF